jgi:hypothetical protein
MMRTLGLDLASQDANTAYCAIEWISERALVETPRVGRPEVEVLDEMAAADWVGIDAPFGWPDAMVEALHQYATTGHWPKEATPQRLRYRTTDWFVHDLIADERDVKVWPLSVSSDRIAVCAWRCARLLSEYAERTRWRFDRVGVRVVGGLDGPPESTPRAGGAVEVYPAGALAMWGLPFRGYKGRTGGSAAKQAARDVRATIVERLEDLGAGWLMLPPEAKAACLDSDDALDAFLSSLVACAAATERTIAPAAEQRGAAQREGWIHLPEQSSIESLAPAAV